MALIHYPIYGSVANGQILLRVHANSNLLLDDIQFLYLSDPLLPSYSYWSNMGSWTFDCDSINGYMVFISSDTGPSTSHWSMNTGNNSLDFILVTNKNIDYTEANNIMATPGTNMDDIGSLGGRIISPNTSSNPPANILYDSTSLDATEKQYVIYAAIAGTQLTTPVEGTYTKMLSINLIENN